MSFSQDQGYVPSTIEAILTSIMAGVNTQFATSYTYDSFVGTNHYKFMYALAQYVQTNETKTAEIFSILQQYFAITNESIQRPVGTNPGIIENFSRNGFIASVKPPADADAGKIYICVDVDETADDYADTKLELCTLIKDSVAGGIVSQGDQVETIVLSNGQAFDFKFALPDRVEVLLRLTLTLSENNQVVVQEPEVSKIKLIANIAAKYQLGKNFEPQKYFSVLDAPWTSQVLLEYSIDAGANWETEVYDSLFDDLFVIDLANITVIED